MATHLGMKLFLWKVAWYRLPTHALLRDKGMELPASSPIYGLDDEYTE